jgi:hypothetical protein
VVLQHKQHLLLAAVTVLLCTASNLAAPVLSGMLFEHLVQQRPVQEYAQVRHTHALLLLSAVLSNVSVHYAHTKEPLTLPDGAQPAVHH